jgi:hypothetical protein
VRDLLPPLPQAPAAAFPMLGSSAIGTPAKAAVDRLVAALQQQVDPSSWRDRGGDSGTIRELAGQLIVTQSVQNQQATAAYLARLRHRRTYIAKLSDVACWAVPSALLLFFVLLRVRRHRGERWLASGRCRACGYDLRASVGRCPECGEVFTANRSPQAEVRRVAVA